MNKKELIQTIIEQWDYLHSLLAGYDYGPSKRAELLSEASLQDFSVTNLKSRSKKALEQNNNQLTELIANCS